MKKKPKLVDDGRVIADMSFEGTNLERADQTRKSSGKDNVEQLDRRQTKYAIWGALLAGLLIGLVFILVFFLFLLFATKVWFK